MQIGEVPQDAVTDEVNVKRSRQGWLAFSHRTTVRDEGKDPTGAREAALKATGSRPTRVMDGFLLLETCRVEFPDQATHGQLDGLDIGDVAVDDLQYAWAE